MRHHLISDILADEALLLNLNPMMPFAIFPAKGRPQRNDQGNAPHQNDHGRNSLGSPLLDVVDARYGPVSETYNTKSNDTG